MQKFILFHILLLAVAFSGCSKTPAKTDAKIKLGYSGILNLGANNFAGGAILFGKSSQGESFGKILNGLEENLDLTNGSWQFYALMWEDAGGENMNGVVRCGKSAGQLNGTDMTISMSLSNDACTDADFSAGRHYIASTKKRFSQVYVEECDKVSGITNGRCGVGNQGSGLSYRFVFRDFKKGPGGNLNFGGATLNSSCKTVNATSNANNIYFSGLPINFPSGNNTFIGQIEIFLGNTTCANDAKGSYLYTLNQGLGAENPTEHKVIFSSFSCSSLAARATLDETKRQCEDILGTMNASSCINVPVAIMSFLLSGPECSTLVNNGTGTIIKHLISTPKDFLCDRYANQSGVIGAHPFSGGDGSYYRPYKVCNEWQLNQIGELGAAANYSSSYYKLMNDLDMNRVDFGPYTKPTCTGASPTLVDDHHNLNPLDRLFDGGCNSARSTGSGFQGVFYGNNKIISNARIYAETTSRLGFVRELSANASIRDLRFKNLEVRGMDYVGGVAGYVFPSAAEIRDITIDKGEIEAQYFSTTANSGSFVGGVAGFLAGGTAPYVSKILNAQLSRVTLKGNDNLGGIAGVSQGDILMSMFRGVIDGRSEPMGNNIGGITASNGGSIKESFSEGYINSYALYTGGGAGFNSGIISDVYSTMNFTLRRYVANPNYLYAGGIVGKNTSGTANSVQNCYSDTKFTNPYSSSLYYGGIIGQVTGAAITTLNNCFTHANNSPSSFVSSMDYDQMRSTAVPSAVSMTTPSKWVYYNGILPKLSWQSRECFNTLSRDTVANQVSSGRGTLLNPVVICNIDQLGQISGRAASEYYVIAEDINLEKWTSSTSLISQFNGTMDAQNAMLYGLTLNLPAGTTENIGIVKKNTGLITRLNLVNNVIDNSNDTTDLTNGLLVGLNEGRLEDVKIFDSHLAGVNRVGLLIGENSGGSVNKIEIGPNIVKGNFNVGTVIGSNVNAGVVRRVSSRADIQSSVSSAYSNMGGIVGYNNALVDQVVFKGGVGFSIPSTEASLNAGGVVGFNDTAGVLSNSYFDKYGELKIQNTTNVGGISGKNLGLITKSFSLGKVLYKLTTPGPAPLSEPFHAFLGYQGGSSYDSFYLTSGTLASYLGSTILVSCYSTYVAAVPTTAAMAIPSNPNSADLTSFPGYSRNGIALSPITLPQDFKIDLGSITCVASSVIELFRSYTNASISGINAIGLSAFKSPATFSSFDMAYTDHAIPANSTRQEDLFEFHRAMMDKRVPTRPSPIWELENDEEHPRLVQVND